MKLSIFLILILSLISCESAEESLEEESVSSSDSETEDNSTVASDESSEQVDLPDPSSNSVPIPIPAPNPISDLESDDPEEAASEEPASEEPAPPVTFTGTNYFGDFEDFSFSLVYNTQCGSDDYALVGYGGVIYDLGYKLDLDDSGNDISSSYAMYYSDNKNCLIAAGTGTDNSSYNYWYTWTGLDSREEIEDAVSLTSGNMLVTPSYFSSNTIEYASKYYISDQSFACHGSSAYLKLEDTGDSLDNFMTKQADWVFGFTMMQDWELWGGAPQMFVDASTAGGVGNFGIGGYTSLSSFSPSLSVSYSGGVTYESISGYYISELPKSGDSVIFSYAAATNEITMFVNGVEAFSESTHWIISSADTDRSFYWGKAKMRTGSLFGDTYHGPRMPTNWFTKIKDLWIANDLDLDESEIALIVNSINSVGDLSNYANYQSKISHHWSLTEDLAADKGGIDFTRELD
jgi:hypothetical protein